ncbi:MAG: hypothetical protein EBT95_09390 [Verrucomicrobia bacterium]|nr:hypothetical protein [Verrucomicrobiota bacterium]
MDQPAGESGWNGGWSAGHFGQNSRSGGLLLEPQVDPPRHWGRRNGRIEQRDPGPRLWTDERYLERDHLHLVFSRNVPQAGDRCRKPDCPKRGPEHRDQPGCENARADFGELHHQQPANAGCDGFRKIQNQRGGVQEHRWNYSADLTNVRTTGDIQSSGLSILSKEVTGAGPRLLAIQTGSASVAPVIFAQPQAQSLNLGATLSLSVATDGSTAVSYQWRKDGVALVGATGPNLVIAAAGLSDAGTYTCEVSNAYGTSTSSAATVAVSAAPILARPPSMWGTRSPSQRPSPALPLPPMHGPRTG